MSILKKKNAEKTDESVKNIWFLNHYASGMYFRKGGRHYYFSKYLKQKGYNPVVFAANSGHGNGEQFFSQDALYTECVASEINVPFVFVRTRSYIGNGLKRVLNMLDFYFNVKKVAKRYVKGHSFPEIIYASSVHPLTLLAGIQLAKRYKVKCICEVRDLWPESITEYGVASKRNPLVMLLYMLEHWMYYKADALVFTMEGGAEYIRDKRWDRSLLFPVDLSKVYHINNGVDLATFDFNCTKYMVDDEDLNNEKSFKIVYTGSVRKANNLGILLNVAQKLTDRNIIFLIWGNGDGLDNLTNQIRKEKIENVKIKGPVQKNYIPYILSKANLTVLNYEMHDIWKYGGSQNKLFEYLASGTPVLTNLKMGYDLIDRYNCGFHLNYSDDSSLEMLQKIVLMKDEDYRTLCENARKASVNYDYKVLANKVASVIEKYV